MIKTADLKYLFEPESVAVIGASHNKDKIGYKILDNIVHSKYKGKIYPVNPEGGKILGLKTYKTAGEIEGNIDLACIAIPAKYVLDAVKELGNKKAKFLSIISSGFSEIGNHKDENEIVEYALAHGMRVLGPNIFGTYSAKAPINASFGPSDITPGSIAFITQSGAIGTSLIGKTKFEDIGLSSIISLGNKSDIDEADLMEYLITDNETRIILMYIEGVKNGEKFIGALKKAMGKKPIIVIKSGRSKTGAKAAASHTGSLAGNDEIFSDIMRQYGVIRAETIQEALNWCKFLSVTPVPKGENTVIITNGGGLGVMAADACEKYKVTLYDDIENLKKLFKDEVPAFGSAKNPVDLTGQARAEDYEKAINAALRAENIHTIVCQGCESAVLDIKKVFSLIENIFADKNLPKPIVLSFLGGEKMEGEILFYKTRGLPVFSDVYDAISCLGASYKNYRNIKYKSGGADDTDFSQYAIDFAAIDAVIDKVKADKRQFLFSFEGMAILRALGVDGPKSFLANNIEQSIKYAEEIGYPVVMKIVSRDILHKSDAGGIALNLENKNEVMDAYQAIMHNCRRYNPYAKIDGIEVAEMVVKKGLETIVGARRDNIFGPIVMFGMGGIYVEVMKDVSFRAFPLNRKEVPEMISQIKSYPLLLGVRGEKRKDIDGIIDVIIKAGIILRKYKDISDIEINPLIAYEEGEGVKTLDARIILSPTDAGARQKIEEVNK
jgi:acetyltransferase